MVWESRCRKRNERSSRSLDGAVRCGQPLWTGAGKLVIDGRPNLDPVPVEALIFDLGGTLDGDGQSWRERFRCHLQKAVVAATREQIERALEVGERAVMSHPQAGTLSLGEMVRIHVRAQLATLGLSQGSRLAEHLSQCFLGETLAALHRYHAVLARLARRLPLALVSNGCGNTRRLADECGLEAFFTTVVDSTEVGAWKPSPRIFEAALGRLTVPAYRVAAVGDRLDRDIEAAHAAGLLTIWVAGRRRLDPADPLSAQVDAVVRSVGELDPGETS